MKFMGSLNSEAREIIISLKQTSAGWGGEAVAFLKDGASVSYVVQPVFGSEHAASSHLTRSLRHLWYMEVNPDDKSGETLAPSLEITELDESEAQTQEDE